MKILVTGGTGFSGSHLVRRLLHQGHQVVALDNQRGRFFDELQKLGAEIVLGSVADRDLVWQVTRGCDIVHHLAAAFRQVNLPQQMYWDVNVEGTRYLLEAALHHGVQKFVNCSTCGVHGDIKREPADETSPIAPADYYQYAKYEAEKVIPEVVAKGLRVVTLRPTAIYGPGDPERFFMLFKRISTGFFPMFGNGKVHYHPLYIDNLVDAFELAAASDKGSGEAYLIGDEHYCTLNELVLAIAETLGVELTIRHFPFWPLWTVALACELVYKPLPLEPPLFRRRVDWFRQNRAFSIQRAKQELGYHPRIGLKEGLAATAQWYREHGYL
jgi:nucleoside-diphosphate-sugar epimerase